LWFDPILARAAAREPLIQLQYQTRLRGFSQDAEGVSATLESLPGGDSRALRASYLVGCDGGASIVRRSLGIELEGEVLSYSVGIYFTAKDLLQHHRMGKGTRYWIIGEEGTWGNLTVVDAKDIWRLTITGGKEKVESEKFDAEHWLRRCLGRDDIEYRIDAVMPWRRNRMLAASYGSGRVFLAGDACHLNAPNGGFGMNTGLGDAVDIGWKLQAVLQGWAPPELLATYEVERRPIARRNVDAAARNFTLTRPKLSYRHVEEDGPEGEATRAALREALFRDTRPEWETTGAHLGYRYEGSPLIVPDGTPEPFDDLSTYVPCARPGHRAPHFDLPDGRSVLDLFGKSFVILQFGPADSTDRAAALLRAARTAGVPCESIRIEDDAAHRLYERRLVLVRPDGHVAWRDDEMRIPPAQLIAIVTGCVRSGEATRASPTGAE
ncbi:MAG: FAD-dependent monooxygenase, partial [Steroidobacteraceae bacterium]